MAGGLHGVGASVVNACSEWLTVNVRRDGHEYEQTFRRGDPDGPLKCIGTVEPGVTGTRVTFKPDPEMFKDTTVYNFETLEKRLREEIRRGVQTIQYQVVTLLTTNGQAPFITVFMYLNEARSEQEKRDLAVIIEEMLEQRYQGVKNEQGVWVTPAFPKLIYVLEEDNIHDDSPYYYLTQLAAKCTARRMVPDYISEKKMLELKGDVYPCMGCRSFLTPDRFTDAGVGNIANAGNYVPGKHKYYGRFNQGVVTINLPDVALSSGGNIEKFWTIFEERLELCHRALRCRHDRLKGTLSDAAPILWQYGACARLKKGEPIDLSLIHI